MYVAKVEDWELFDDEGEPGSSLRRSVPSGGPSQALLAAMIAAAVAIEALVAGMAITPKTSYLSSVGFSTFYKGSLDEKCLHHLIICITAVLNLRQNSYICSGSHFARILAFENTL